MRRYPRPCRIRESSAIAVDPAWLDSLHESVGGRRHEGEAVLQDDPTVLHGGEKVSLSLRSDGREATLRAYMTTREQMGST